MALHLENWLPHCYWDRTVYFPQDDESNFGVRFWEEDEKPGVFLYVDDTTLLDLVGADEVKIHLRTAAATATFDNLNLEDNMRELTRRAEDTNM